MPAEGGKQTVLLEVLFYKFSSNPFHFTQSSDLTRASLDSNMVVEKLIPVTQLVSVYL